MARVVGGGLFATGAMTLSGYVLGLKAGWSPVSEEVPGK